jgi:hypothetical protein
MPLTAECWIQAWQPETVTSEKQRPRGRSKLASRAKDISFIDQASLTSATEEFLVIPRTAAARLARDDQVETRDER